jgi:hypothetical protein
MATDLALKADAAAVTTALAAKADLVGGKVPTSQLPSIPTFVTHPVASQSAMLALTAAVGDVAIRSDLSNARFFLIAEPPSTLGNWLLLNSDPTAGVDMINGHVGNVTLGYADVGADAAGAAAAAVVGLAPLASPVLTGNPVAPTQATGDNSTKLATTALVAAKISALTLGTASTHASTDFEPAGLASGTLTSLHTLFDLTDPGSIQQWTGSTPANRGSVWAYQGVLYWRNATGTDSVFTRANWVALGADPSVAAGGELAATPMSASFSSAFTANQNKDLTGMTASPVIPSSGRGIYVDFSLCMTSSVASNAVTVYLYDVTAAALATTSAYVLIQPLASQGYTITGRWRLAPAGGARTYKIQIVSKLAATVGCVGEDIGFEGLLTFTAR